MYAYNRFKRDENTVKTPFVQNCMKPKKNISGPSGERDRLLDR